MNIQVKNFREKWARFSAYWQTEWYELSHGITETDRKPPVDKSTSFLRQYLNESVLTRSDLHIDSFLIDALSHKLKAASLI